MILVIKCSVFPGNTLKDILTYVGKLVQVKQVKKNLNEDSEVWTLNINYYYYILLLGSSCS